MTRRYQKEIDDGPGERGTLHSGPVVYQPMSAPPVSGEPAGIVENSEMHDERNSRYGAKEERKPYRGIYDTPNSALIHIVLLILATG